jgi:hypothetical protein
MSMEPTAHPRRFSYSFLASFAGGFLVSLDYVIILIIIAELPPGDVSGINALPYVLVGLGGGVAILIGSYFYRLSGFKRWLYIVMIASLLSLFIAISIVSSAGSVLGSASALYLLTKDRPKPVPPKKP